MKRAWALIGFAALAGCVERKMVIRSEPEGADVRVDGTVVGKTPVEVPFAWYGTREIELEKHGFQSVTKNEEIFPQWWQMPVFDLFTDVLIPAHFEDTRPLDYALEAAPKSQDPGPFLQRARTLKGDIESRP